DRALVDVGQGVAWLRAHGAETVVLLGNSGGGSLMAAYNAQVQGDVITSSFGIPVLPEVNQLLPGDLYVSLAAHPGRPEVLTGCTRRGPTRPPRPRSPPAGTGPPTAASRRSTRSSSGATGPGSGPATSGSPTGPRPSWPG